MDDPLELPSKWRFNNDNDDQLNGIVCQPQYGILIFKCVCSDVYWDDKFGSDDIWDGERAPRWILRPEGDKPVDGMGHHFFWAQLQLDVEIHPFQGEEDFKYAKYGVRTK